MQQRIEFCLVFNWTSDSRVVFAFRRCKLIKVALINFPDCIRANRNKMRVSTKRSRFIKWTRVSKGKKEIGYTIVRRCSYIMQVSSLFSVVKKKVQGWRRARSRNHLLRGLFDNNPPQLLVTRKPTTLVASNATDVALILWTVDLKIWGFSNLYSKLSGSRSGKMMEIFWAPLLKETNKQRPIMSCSLTNYHDHLLIALP